MLLDDRFCKEMEEALLDFVSNGLERIVNESLYLDSGISLMAFSQAIT